MIPTMIIGNIIKNATRAKNENISHDTAAKSTHIINNKKSAKTIRTKETSHHNDCFMW